MLHDKLTPRLVWEHTKDEIIFSPNGAILFDDTVLDKNSSQTMELARWQYSGVYFNPDCHKFWVIDYRIYSPDQDGKSKIDHTLEIFKNAIYAKNINFKYVLMDSWYASHKVMLAIDDEAKIFYCPLKSNRLVSHVDEKYFHEPVSNLIWKEEDLSKGKRVHINKFPNNFKGKLQKIITAGNLYETNIKTAGGIKKIYFHSKGINKAEVEMLLEKICIDSKLPESVRLAHIIGKIF